VGGGTIDNTVPHRFTAYAGMDMGCDNGGVVERSYALQAPFPFTGTIKQVVFDIVPLPTPDDELAAHQATIQGRVVAGINA
jgi:arylsulfatase